MLSTWSIRYDTRCYFNVRSKADMSRLNPDLPRSRNENVWDRPPFRGRGNFFSGGEAALPVMRPLSKFSDSCFHSCCRTDEIKFSIKPITRKTIQNQSDARTYTISVLPTPRILNGHSATDRKLCRCAAKNESTLAQSFTMDDFWSRETVTVPCVWWSRTWILASQVSIKVTREWEL